MRTLLCSRVRAGFTLNIIDTPGLVEGLFVNDHALDTIRRYISCMDIGKDQVPYARISLGDANFINLA